MNLNDFISKLIGQADRLSESESKLTALGGQLESAISTLSEREAEISRLNKELAESKDAADDIVKISGERDFEKARADKAEADLKAEQDAMPGKINAEVSRITGQSHAPVSTTSNAGSGDIGAQLAAISDPAAKTKFIRENRAAIAAAHRNQN